MSEFKRATRQGVNPLVVLFSESGCGKTMSSLLLARGFVGPQGKIGMIDSESGRGSLYADVIDGGYEVLNLDPPFTPKSYIDAIEGGVKAGYSILVIDSGSHEWEGAGGVLDIAGENEHRSGKAGLHNWRVPKMEHAKFVLSLLRSPIPLIVCLRAKFKTRQTKDDNRKTVIVKDEFTSPIQAEDFIFESTLHGEIMPDHFFRLTKASHPALRDCFPTKGPITVEHGAMLAKWCQAPPAAGKAAERPASEPEASQPKPANDPLKKLKSELWRVTQAIHKGDLIDGKQLLEQWLWDELCMGDQQNLDSLDLEGYKIVIEKAKAKFK